MAKLIVVIIGSVLCASGVGMFMTEATWVAVVWVVGLYALALAAVIHELCTVEAP